EPEQIGKAVQVAALGGENRYDHGDDQRDRRESADEPDQQQRPTHELSAGGEQRIEARRRNAELREEAGHLVQVMKLAPAGANEDDAERQARQGGADPRQAIGGGKEGSLCSRKKVHDL